MNCRHVINKLSAYIDGELTGDEMILIRSHVNDCKQCACELASVRKTKLLLSKLRTVIPREELLTDLVASIDATNTSKLRSYLLSHHNMFSSRFAKAGFATALCGILVFVMYLSSFNSANEPYNANYNMALAGPATQLRHMPNIPGLPYCISNDRPLQLVNQTSLYSIDGHSYEMRHILQTVSAD